MSTDGQRDPSKVPPDLDLRLVRYFTVVAAHGGFGRAAQALHVAQPSLSRQIQRLEHQLGVRLLERTSRGCELTAAGDTFLPHAHSLLNASQRAHLAARSAEPEQAIVVGYVDDLIITQAIRDVRRRHPTAQVRTLHLDWNDAHSALLTHRVDALVARLPSPLPLDRVEVLELYEESRVLVVPASHPLADRVSVQTDDFGTLAVVPCAVRADPSWRAFWRLEPRSDGLPAPVAPTTVETYEDKLELIAEGRAVAVMAAGDRRLALREEVTAVPIDDVAPCRVVVATRAGDEDALVAAFVQSAAVELLPAPSRHDFSEPLHSF